MADEEVAVREPNIGFDAAAAGGERVVERHLAPVVVV